MVRLRVVGAAASGAGKQVAFLFQRLDGGRAGAVARIGKGLELPDLQLGAFVLDIS